MKNLFMSAIAGLSLLSCSPSSHPAKSSISGLLNAGLPVGFIAPTEFECNFPGVKTLNLPLYPNRPDSPTFELKYQVVGEITEDSVAMVYLPGGPGGSSMSDYSKEEARQFMLKFGLPSKQPWIFFDPRTSGCNRGDEKIFPDDSLTSEYLAEDVLAVLKSLKIKKYMILGHSYGTQWGTFVAGLAEAGHGPKPQFLLLSGILGHGTADGSFTVQNHLKYELSQLKLKLTPKSQEILNSEKPLGVGIFPWSHFLTKGLYAGALPREGVLVNGLLEDLNKLDSNDPEVVKALTDKVTTFNQIHVVQRDFSNRLYAKIDCHEFAPHETSPIFSKGEFILDPDDHLCDLEAYDRPYDSAQLQISAPIYYIAGTADPAAPYEGAYYHFQNQKHSRRNFVKIEGGGHTMIGELFPDCVEQMWDSMVQLKDWDLASCKTPHELTVLPSASE